MRRISIIAAALVATFALGSSANASTCTGNCGHSGPDGVVTVAPTGDGTYDWVSTNQGQFGAARITGYSSGATNGSELVSDAFFAAAGSKINFWFNYITSDGAGFADYGFAQLLHEDGTTAANLFTARTKPSGTIVPGLELPGLEATLSPATVPIKPGGPQWAPLGGSSGSCYSSGCGYTGWIQSEYTVADDGTYQLRFGTANWSDQIYDTGLAFSGLLLNGDTIGNGSSPDSPLLPTGEVGPNGEFQFTFTPTPGIPVFIDPEIASGYIYQIITGSNLITNAIFPTITGDTDGYDVYLLDGTLLASGVMNYNFGSGVLGFKLLDIDADAGLDPTNPAAFVTGLSFFNGNEVTVTQTPITVNIPGGVPEPSTWAVMVLGFGLTGMAARRSKKMLRAA